MKKLLLLLLLLLLTACNSTEYVIVSTGPVDGYYIYEKRKERTACNSVYSDIYYSGDIYNYGYEYVACNWEMHYFILQGEDYVYLQEALEAGTITLDSLRPELHQIEREPEEFEYDVSDADYYWLDFHIDSSVVYAYAGGECDQAGFESFHINGSDYIYEASGCLESHILYMQVDGDYVPIADLITEGTIDGTYLIPLLTESTD